jgi:hypothetical protein
VQPDVTSEGSFSTSARTQDSPEGQTNNTHTNATKPESSWAKNAKKAGWGLGFIVAAPVCLGLGAAAGTVFAAGVVLKGAGDLASGLGGVFTGGALEESDDSK